MTRHIMAKVWLLIIDCLAQSFPGKNKQWLKYVVGSGALDQFPWEQRNYTLCRLQTRQCRQTAFVTASPSTGSFAEGNQTLALFALSIKSPGDWSELHPAIYYKIDLIGGDLPPTHLLVTLIRLWPQFVSSWISAQWGLVLRLCLYVHKWWCFG